MLIRCSDPQGKGLRHRAYESHFSNGGPSGALSVAL